MEWSEALVLVFTSSISSVVIKELFDIARGRTRAARELTEWKVWGLSLITSLAKDGVDMNKYPKPPAER